MPKTVTIVMDVPSGSRPLFLKEWINQRLKGHNMRVTSVEEGRPFSIKSMLHTMFTGWQKREASWDGDQYTLSEEEAMTEAANGDMLYGSLLHYFSHWSNDIQTAAAHYGIAFSNDEDKAYHQLQIIDVPEPPSPDHWWDKGEWKEPHPTDEVAS